MAASSPQRIATLRFIASHPNRPPTVREIGEKFKIGLQAVFSRLKWARRAGLITSEPRKARTLRLTHAGRIEAGLPPDGHIARLIRCLSCEAVFVQGAKCQCEATPLPGVWWEGVHVPVQEDAT